MARDFVSASNHVITLGTEDEYGTDDKISVFAAINPDSVAAFHTIVCKRDTSIMTWQLRIGQTSGDAGLFWTYMDGGTFVNFDTGGSKFTISTGSWQYVGVTFDWSNHTTCDYFKDGSKQTLTSTATVSGAPDDAGVPITIGKRTNDSMQYDGKIAEIGIWNRELTDTEMLEMTGNRLSPLFYPRGLTHYLPLTDTGSTERNLITPNNGTVTGATVSDHPPILYPSDDQLMMFAAENTAIKDLIMGGIIPFSR